MTLLVVAAVASFFIGRLSIVNGFIVAPLNVNVFSSRSYESPDPVSVIQCSATTGLGFSRKDDNDNNDNNPNDPTTWHYDLSPVIFAQYFARDDISAEYIQELLQVNSISILEDFDSFQAFNVLDSISRQEVTMTQLFGTLVEALNRPRIIPAKLLGGEVVYDVSCISETCFNMYTFGAVSVHPLAMAPTINGTRNNEFSLVLGPSGTGKTIFALRRLPQLACSTNLTECFRIHFRAATVAARMEDNKSNDFPGAVAALVQDMIETKLADRNLAGKKVKNIDLFLHVTIDEAGGESSGEYFGSAEKILRIVNALKQKMVYNFTKAVHVTVTGTGLEEITADILSQQETTKFRTRPWTVAQFDALADASNHPQPGLVKAVVRKFAILNDLITNGRCSYFILISTTNTAFLQNVLLTGFVKVLVSAVASQYISSNAMSYIKTAKEKWEVCRSVWKQLDKAMSMPNVAFFPRFDDIEKEALRDAAKLLMDCNVETRKGNPEFVDKTNIYSLSVSPALTIVMAKLLNANAELTWNWQDFETVVMLSEMKRMVTNSEVIPRNPERPIIELSSRLPSAWNARFCSIPVVNRYTVVLNGPIASYADIIAPYRFVQTKFMKVEGKRTVDLEMTKELDKMGLLITDRYPMQQNLTSTFYLMWETLESAPPATVGKTYTTRKTERVEFYPFNTLTTPESVDEPVTISYNTQTCKLELKDEEAARMYPSEDERVSLVSLVQQMNEPGPLLQFDEHRPVTAVFVTNTDSFRAIPENEMEFFVVERKDVDWQGRLKKKTIPEGLAMMLRKNVEVLFQFI